MCVYIDIYVYFLAFQAVFLFSFSLQEMKRFIKCEIINMHL